MRYWLIILGFVCWGNLSFGQDTTAFQLCEGKVFPYYYPGLKYQGGFWEIKQHFLKDYPQSEWQGWSQNTGIVVVQFKVNCKGQPGDYTFFSTDLNYRRTKLNAQIERYFVEKTRTLKNWIPAKTEDGQFVNSHKFFSFRLIDGELTEILPK